jgi:hypothetical protein
MRCNQDKLLVRLSVGSSGGSAEHPPGFLQHPLRDFIRLEIQPPILLPNPYSSNAMILKKFPSSSFKDTLITNIATLAIPA